MWTDAQVREVLSAAYLDAFKMGQLPGSSIEDLNAVVETYIESYGPRE